MLQGLRGWDSAVEYTPAVLSSLPGGGVCSHITVRRAAAVCAQGVRPLKNSLAPGPSFLDDIFQCLLHAPTCKHPFSYKYYMLIVHLFTINYCGQVKDGTLWLNHLIRPPKSHDIFIQFLNLRGDHK